jgi:hypothetical protein
VPDVASPDYSIFFNNMPLILQIIPMFSLPVVPHKAVAEVSKIGNL